MQSCKIVDMHSTFFFGMLQIQKSISTFSFHGCLKKKILANLSPGGYLCKNQTLFIQARLMEVHNLYLLPHQSHLRNKEEKVLIDHFV